MTKLAQIDFNELQGDIGFEEAPTDIGGFISRIIPYVFAFAGIGLLVYLLIGGFTMMTSGGDPKKVESGKAIITNAFIGFIVVFVSYWIVQLVGQIFGLDIIQTTFPGGGS